MQKLKKLLSMILVIACVITMIPQTAFAEFTTDSSTTSGSGKKYNTKTNIVNVGYRISLYYAGKDEKTGKKYMPALAYNASGNPIMFRTWDYFTTANYTSTKNEEAAKVPVAYFRDLAAKKSSILVLNGTGDSFGSIYQLKPTSDYGKTKMTWDEVESNRICKKDSSNAVYKWINKYTGKALSEFQSKSWLGTKQGASSIVDAKALDGIDKEFSERKLTAKRELIKAFKNYTTDGYYNLCVNDPNNVYIQIEPVAIFSSKDFGYEKGFMATWAEVRLACAGATSKEATQRGCFSWRSKPNYDLGKSLIKGVKTKTLTSNKPKKTTKKVTFYTTSYENSTNRSCAAASILGTLYNKTAFGKSTQLTKGFSSCSGVAYYGCSYIQTPSYENVESISLLYTGKLNEDSMNIEDGTWSQANALATFDVEHSLPTTQRLFGEKKKDDLTLAKYIDYTNQEVLKKYGQIYTYAKGTDYKAEKTKSSGSVGYSTQSKTDGYNLVAYYNYLVNNKKATVKSSDLAKGYDNAVRGLINEKNGLLARWQRSVVGNGSTGLNAGYTVNFKSIASNKYNSMFNIIENQVVKPAYQGLKATPSMGRVMEYPYYAVPSSDAYATAKVDKNKEDNILSDADEKTAKVLVKTSMYTAAQGKDVANNVLILGGKKSLATQAYYLEGVAFKGTLGSNLTTMQKLNQIMANRKYALNVLVAAKIADVTSYYTWSTYDFSKNNFASHGNTSKTYDITSNGLFPLGENGQKGIKRVIIVPNPDNGKMAISQNELDSIVSRACQSADESQSEKTILASIWNDLRATLEERANSKAYTGSVRDHYNDLLDQYSDADMFKHNGSETAAVGFYQDDNVKYNVDNSSEKIEEEGSEYQETEVDEEAEKQTEKEDASKTDSNEAGQQEADDISILKQYGMLSCGVC